MPKMNRGDELYFIGYFTEGKRRFSRWHTRLGEVVESDSDRCGTHPDGTPYLRPKSHLPVALCHRCGRTVGTFAHGLERMIRHHDCPHGDPCTRAVALVTECQECLTTRRSAE